MTTEIKREALHQAIDQLPESTFIELARFIEFLQFKVQRGEQINEIGGLAETAEISPFKPVHFPEGVLTGVDFSPEYIARARKELWAGFGGPLE